MKYKLISNDTNGDIIELICRNRKVDFRNLDKILLPTKEAIQNPLIYSNLEKVCNAIAEAVSSGKKIALVVDSDVDGYCSSAMLINYLHNEMNYDNICWLLHTGKEHGLTKDMMKRLFEVNADVVILPDSSSNDFAQHKELVEAGKVVLVIDHHEADRFSTSATVVNNQLDNFGNKTLCGGGMVMKVLEYMDDLYCFDGAEKYMDLCATALVGDCMIMTNPETRYYVQKGLRNINNPLLYELYKAEGSRDFEMISFDIAPTINAFIRVGTYDEKLDLFNALIGFDYLKGITIRGKGEFTLPLPEYISALANRIKSRQNSQITKALESQCEIIGEDLPFAICLIDLEVNKNLTGLIANRLVDKLNKPVIVLKDYNGVLKGSARTLDTFPNFKDYIANLGCFLYAEGHQGAFGLGITREGLNHIMKELSGQAIGEESDVYLVDKAYVDIVSAYEIMSVSDFKEHWCRGFEKPIFHITLNDVNNTHVDIIGQKRDTIRIKHNHITYLKFKCTEEEIKEVESKMINGIELIGTFEVNEWNDRLYPQVHIEKLELKGEVTQEPNKNNPFGFAFNGFGGIKW